MQIEKNKVFSFVSTLTFFYLYKNKTKQKHYET